MTFSGTANVTETEIANGNGIANGTKTNIDIATVIVIVIVIAIEIGKSIIGHKGPQTYILISLFLHASLADFGSFSEGGTIRSVIATAIGKTETITTRVAQGSTTNGIAIGTETETETEPEIKKETATGTVTEIAVEKETEAAIETGTGTGIEAIETATHEQKN